MYAFLGRGVQARDVLEVCFLRLHFLVVCIFYAPCAFGSAQIKGGGD